MNKCAKKNTCLKTEDEFVFLISIPISNVGFLELYQHNTGTIFAFMRNNTDVEPSFIYCKLCFTTVPENNKGIPHALEHLLFNGSKKFPFNDSIDKISNRLHCTYTNAFTSDDSTSFEFESIDKNGFHSMLYVWLDHLLNPNFTEEFFLTEIVHLDNNAEYQGVVYSEVSSYEKKYDEIVSVLSKFFTLCDQTREYNTNLESTWELYDEITRKCNNMHNGIFSCTGRTVGLANLSMSELMEFHSKYYSLDNLLIFVSGNKMLDKDPIFNVFRNFISENNLFIKNSKSEMSDSNNLVFKRKHYLHCEPNPTTSPWNLVIPFPVEEEELGSVSFTWKFGEFSNIKEMISISVLLHYLASDNDSPLIKEFVEKRSICSDIDILSTCEVHRFHQILFQGVETKKSKELISLFKMIVSEYRGEKRKLSLSDIKCKVEGLYYAHLMALESETVSTVYQQLINYLNYGLKNGLFQVEKYLNIHKYLEELFEEDICYWQKLFIESFDLERMNCIEFIPSEKLSRYISKQHEFQKKERLNKNKRYYDNIRSKLESAIELNKKRSIPSTLLDSFNIELDLKKIKLSNVSIVTDVNFSKVELGELYKECDLKFKSYNFQEFGKNCLYFYLINPNTEFFNIQLRLNINDNISPLYKLLTSFIVELIFQTSVEIINHNNTNISEEYRKLRDKRPFIPELKFSDKEIVNYDKFDKLMNVFCIDYIAEFVDGWILDSNSTPNQIKISWTTPKKYIEFSCIFVMSAICGMKITQERVLTVARSMKGAIMELKLSEESLINCVSNSLCYSKKSLFNIVNIPNFEKIINELIKNPKKYLCDLKKAHELLIKPFSPIQNDKCFFSMYVVGPEEFSNINVKKYFTYNNVSHTINTPIKKMELSPWKMLSNALPLKLGIEFNMENMEFNFQKYGNSIFVKIPSSPTACFIQTINLNNFSCFEPNATHFYNPDIPPLLVLSDYLWDPCSLIFNTIRGNGLAYSGHIEICMSTGRISSCVFESTSIGGSLLKIWEIFREISLTDEELNNEIKVKGKAPYFYTKFYNNLNINEAIRTSIFKQISKYKKISSWAEDFYFNMSVGVEPSFDKYIIEKILNVTIDDLKRVSQKYLKLFLPGSTTNGNPSSCIAFCGGSKSVNDVKEKLATFPEFKFKVISLSDFTKEMYKNVNTERQSSLAVCNSSY